MLLIKIKLKFWNLRNLLTRITLHFSSIKLAAGEELNLKSANGIFKLHESTHVAAEKTDGERFLLLIDYDSSYLISRKLEFRKIRFRFPQAPIFAKKSSEKYIGNTILDGELLKDSSGKIIFYIFDCLAVNGEVTTKLNYIERLKQVQNQIIAPLNHFGEGQSFITFKLKDFYPIWHIDWIFNEYIPRLEHHSDGIIFNHLTEPYMQGKTPSLLKWKPESENTCDFTVSFENNSGKRLLRLFIADGGELVRLDDFLCHPYPEELISYLSSEKQRAIIECFWDRKSERITDVLSPNKNHGQKGKPSGGWKYLRLRDDKNLPNDVTVMINVISSIAECISRDEVREYHK